ncbi:MAG: SDR family NAD(P)-dependent oxidoreductase [Thermomicrobiales bacterium]
MNWSGRPVLVTGAGGFIGSHLTEELVRRGARVRAFLHYRVMGERASLEWSPPEILDEIEFVSGDLRDVETVTKAVRGNTSVFHLAALIGIPYSYRSPRDVVETNGIGTLNVLQACRDAEVAQLIHTSTSEVYGTARTVPIREDHPLQGQSPYSASKIGADHLVESFARSFGVPAVIVRPFNTYGPRQSARAIIPTVISQALAGKTLRLGSLDPTRDFNFVGDTAAGFIDVAASGIAGAEVFNLGTGQEISIGELVTKVGDILGTPLEVELDPQRLRPAASEVERLIADASKARTQCGWEPRVTLDEGLRRTIEWIAAHQDTYRPAAYGV